MGNKFVLGFEAQWERKSDREKGKEGRKRRGGGKAEEEGRGRKREKGMSLQTSVLDP